LLTFAHRVVFAFVLGLLHVDDCHHRGDASIIATGWAGARASSAD